MASDLPTSLESAIIRDVLSSSPEPTEPTTDGDTPQMPLPTLQRSSTGSTMRSQKQIPARHELISCNHAVAGHAGTMVDADGELFIKPCTQTEIDFYTSAGRRYPEFADLMPTFYGSLCLNESADAEVLEKGVSEILAQAHVRSPEPAPADAHLENGVWVPNHANPIKTTLSVVLENGTAGFKYPNILDAKLGSRLWADDAPAEKKRRFDKVSAETTSGSLGFRITGSRTYRGSGDPADLDDDNYKVYDKDYGRTVVNKDNVVDAFLHFLCNPAAGVDEPLARAVAVGFLRELRRVEDVLSRHESRMYSASLLFIYEGDGDALQAAIRENNERVEATYVREDDTEARPHPRTATRVDSGISLTDDEGDDESDAESEPDLPKIFRLKLIDFAHAKWTPGQGPDENVLGGVRNLIHVFERLIPELD